MKAKNPKPGDIVLIPFPFTDLSSQKIRPVFILAVSRQNVIVIFITTNTKLSNHSVLIEPTTTNGLKKASIIDVSKIATLDQKMIIGKIGQLERIAIESIRKNLKKFLNI